MVFAILLLVPVAIAAAGYIFSRSINWKEFAVQGGAQVLIAFTCASILHCRATQDTEIWNSRVASKERVEVSCSHTYECHCTESCSSDSKGNKSCTRTCQTCYEHSHDYDWVVHTTTQEKFEIDRIDCQGSYVPPRWARVQIGEPAALPHSYDNYVKAAPDSLFRHHGLTEKYRQHIPLYPEVYDYYNINRVISIGAILPDLQDWNRDLAQVNADLGAAKQANILVVLVHGLPQEYFYALEQAWIGAKKNDIVLVSGVDAEMKPQWAAVMAWTTNDLFKVKLRDDIMDEPALTRDRVMAALKRNVATYYKRKPMKDFEYLSASITPSPLGWGISLGVSILVALALLWAFHVYDPFGEDYKLRRSKRF